MIIYTSFFKNPALDDLDDEDLVAISVGVPKPWRGKRSKMFAPDWSWVEDYRDGIITWEEFTVKYRKKIREYTREKVLGEVEDLKVYLCHEERGNCHRHLFAEVMREDFGVTVIEV